MPTVHMFALADDQSRTRHRENRVIPDRYVEHLERQHRYLIAAIHGMYDRLLVAEPSMILTDSDRTVDIHTVLISLGLIDGYNHDEDDLLDTSEDMTSSPSAPSSPDSTSPANSDNSYCFIAPCARDIHAPDRTLSRARSFCQTIPSLASRPIAGSVCTPAQTAGECERVCHPQHQLLEPQNSVEPWKEPRNHRRTAAVDLSSRMGRATVPYPTLPLMWPRPVSQTIGNYGSLLEISAAEQIQSNCTVLPMPALQCPAGDWRSDGQDCLPFLPNEMMTAGQWDSELKSRAASDDQLWGDQFGIQSSTDHSDIIGDVFDFPWNHIDAESYETHSPSAIGVARA